MVESHDDFPGVEISIAGGVGEMVRDVNVVQEVVLYRLVECTQQLPLNTSRTIFTVTRSKYCTIKTTSLPSYSKAFSLEGLSRGPHTCSSDSHIAVWMKAHPWGMPCYLFGVCSIALHHPLFRPTRFENIAVFCNLRSQSLWLAW